MSARTPDIDREEMNAKKWRIILSHLPCLLTPRGLVTTARADAFFKLNIEALNAQLPDDRKVRGLILDFDDTLAPHHGDITPENLQAIQDLRAQEIPIGVLSNASYDKFTARYKVLEDIGVKIITGVEAKPSPAAFTASAAQIGVLPKNVLFVGDNHLTDGGALRAGMHFAQIQPFPTAWSARVPQRLFRATFRGLARLYEQLW